MRIKLILTDIEGTTSSISFVKDVLFPYVEHFTAFTFHVCALTPMTCAACWPIPPP